MSLLRRHLLPAAFAAFLAAAAPAAAAPGFQAAFDHAPSTPAPGQVITLQATTVNETSTTIRHSWDLDADGQFDDANGDSVQTSFAAAGDYTVALKAERASTSGTTESVASRVIHVANAPVPTPEPEPTPVPTVTPDSNQPPVALYKRGCSNKGGLQICGGLSARESHPRLMDAGPSSDADGTIVRYEWDFDGDGTFERDAGAQASIQHTFERLGTLVDPLKRRVTLRVTDDDGATATDTFTMRIVEPACESQASYLNLRLEGECIKHYHARVGGKPVDRYVSEGPARLNGIAIFAKLGGRLTLDVPRKREGGGPQLPGTRPHVYAKHAEYRMYAEESIVSFGRADIDWQVVGNRLEGFEPVGATVNGLKVTGAPAAPKLGAGTTSYDVYLALPKEFGGATSSTPVRLTAGEGVSARAAGTPMAFHVPSAELGPLSMGGLDVTYDGVDLWEIDATIGLPALADAKIDANAAVTSAGNFAGAGADVSFGSGIPIGGPIPLYLNRISFQVDFRPRTSDCIPQLGGGYGYPKFALCGGIGLTGGPTILGVAAISVDGTLGFATYHTKPWAVRAKGTLSLVDIPLAEGSFFMGGDGYVAAYGEYYIGWKDVASLSGYLSAEFKGSKFNASAGGRACLEFADICRGFEGVFSTKGIAACLNIDVGVGTWTPGIGTEWGELPTPYFDGCDIDDYKVHIAHAHASASAFGAADQVIELPAGKPGAVIAATGASAPPNITLIGPDGERVESAGASNWIETDDSVVWKNPRHRTTQVVLGRPAGGKWRVVVEPGSSPLTDLRSAAGLPEPKIEARVTGKGHDRVLRYDVVPADGQKVTFVERGKNAGGELGVARRRTGTLRFAPAAGNAERRKIVALVEQDGMPRSEVPVTSYDAPGTRRPGTPRRLRVSHRGGAVKVRWDGAAGAFQVRATLSDGRVLVRRTSGHRMTLRRVASTVRGRVRVTGVSASGVSGRAATARVR